MGWGRILSGDVTAGQRWALVSGVGTAFFQQLNGSEAAVYYVPYVLSMAGVTSVRSQLLGSFVVRGCFLPPRP